MSAIAVLIDHDRGVPTAAALAALATAAELAGEMGVTAEAVVLGDAALFAEHGDELMSAVAGHGAAVMHRVGHELLGDYGPDAWGAALGAFVEHRAPAAVLASGTRFTQTRIRMLSGSSG